MEHDSKSFMVLMDFTHAPMIEEEATKRMITDIDFSKPIRIESITKHFERQKQTHAVHGPFSCYAIPLLLPSDKEAREYMKLFSREIDLISGDNCLVVAFTNSRFEGLNSDFWGQLVNGKIHQEYGIKISELFKIDFTQFPCIVIFENTHSPDHILITLKGMTIEEISEIMRETFAIINKAISENKSPLAALGDHRKKEKFYRNGQTIISGLRSVGKTFEIIVKAWMEIFS